MPAWFGKCMQLQAEHNRFVSLAGACIMSYVPGLTSTSKLSIALFPGPI